MKLDVLPHLVSGYCNDKGKKCHVLTFTAISFPIANDSEISVEYVCMKNNLDSINTFSCSREF